jgi:hypothetical protein
MAALPLDVADVETRRPSVASVARPLVEADGVPAALACAGWQLAKARQLSVAMDLRVEGLKPTALAKVAAH